MTDSDPPIDLVLPPHGGLVLALMQMARHSKQHDAKVTEYVPFYAKSGGALIALSADEIVMSQHAVFVPIDL